MNLEKWVMMGVPSGSSCDPAGLLALGPNKSGYLLFSGPERALKPLLSLFCLFSVVVLTVVRMVHQVFLVMF